VGIATFNPGDTVTLSATPDAGSIFSGWSGACTGSGDCHLTMGAARNVTATFTHIPVPGVCGADKGRTLAALAPTALCDKGTPSAITGNGHPWSWSCQGDVDTEPAVCAASIQTFSLAVTVPAGSGRGDVTADVLSNDEPPVSISCPTSFCSALFDFGRTVRLSATPDPVSFFTSWDGGGCATNPCDIAMTGPKAVTAHFTRARGFKNANNEYADSLVEAVQAAATGEEIKMLATEMTIDSMMLKKALKLTGGWNAEYTLQTDEPTTLEGTLTIKDEELDITGKTEISNTTVQGGLFIQRGGLAVQGVTVR
jgi:hypothetical protein